MHVGTVWVQKVFLESESDCVRCFCCRMTVSRLSSWRWQSSTSSRSSWFPSTGTFWSRSGRLAGPPAYQGGASVTRSTPRPVQVIPDDTLDDTLCECVTSDEPLLTHRCISEVMNTGLRQTTIALSRRLEEERLFLNRQIKAYKWEETAEMLKTDSMLWNFSVMYFIKLNPISFWNEMKLFVWLRHFLTT